ncbi:MAG: ABC transporter ATP-binding protein/permease [Candidatus Accumulibacter sp.]|jgi:ABC-type multidrug transport system fused ATPase/permease subunit|nr:ABC transporter ATP-binding protein/permease [Accumulibacter sp.]
MNSVLKKAWSLFTPAERGKAVLILVLCVLMALAETAGVISIMPFLSVLARPEIIEEKPLLRAVYQYFAFADFRGFILGLGMASIVIVVSSSAFKTVTLHVINRFIHLERTSISSRLLACYLRQPYEFFLTRNPSLLGKNILSQTDELIGNLLWPLSQLIAQGAIVLAVTTLIFFHDPLMASCTVAVVAALYGAIFGLVRKRLDRIGREWQAANGLRYQACNEALGGIKDVKITHSASAYEEKFHQAARLVSRHLATNDTLSQSPLYMVEAVGYTGLILIALWLLLKTNDVAHVLPALGLYGFAAYRMLPAVQVMYRGFARLRFSMASLNSIVHDLALPEPCSPGSAAMIVPQREIRLEKIRYAYPSTPDAPVFDGFDLLIEANSSVGIVGKSGGGKSTLMDILLALLRPQSGVLSVDGAPITEERVPAWQRAIGYVPQHIFLSDASVWENIAFGVPPDEVDRQAVERAARAAQIHDFIVNDLQEGYETRVGDRGIRLSGGQRQRIGIARALYRDPPVLFMDEATSALDAQTEEAVNEAIRHLSGRKTVVVIAHKESSLRDCRRIVSL